MRRLTWTFAVVAALAGFAVAPAAWAGTLDQQQTTSDSDIGLLNNNSAAQTFTPDITGWLDQVDLDLLKFGTPPAPVTVEIRNVSAGTPGTTVLASALVPTSAITTSGGFVAIRFTTPVAVTAGTQYAIVAYSPGTGGNAVGWRYKFNGNPYPDGALFNTTASPPGGTWILSGVGNHDAAFKTYVVPNPPPPPRADVDPPETTITKDVKRSDTGKVKFRFVSDEAATFECKLKGPDVKRKLRRFRDCGSPQKYKNLDEGRFKFKVRAIDAAGNVDLTPAKDGFRVLD